jgi:hypothetical protein
MEVHHHSHTARKKWTHGTLYKNSGLGLTKMKRELQNKTGELILHIKEVYLLN